jgi:hypothetical protein
MSELPQADSADTDSVQMALQAAHTLWSRGDTTESLRWLKRAAESASDEGADLRSLQLAKAAAELRAKLFPATSDAPPAPARVPTQRDLTGVRPVADALAHEAEGMAAAGMGGHDFQPVDFKPVTRPEDSPASSRAPSSAPQYVVHRPREPQQQRQLMGLSSSTLETARQHNGASYSNVPSWSASTERRSSPPPLPSRTSIDDYEELDAEPEEESDGHAAATAGWANTAAPTWRPQERTAAQLDVARREGDSSPRVATLPPPSFQPSNSPPPLPELSAFGDDDGDPMRPEQPTVLLPPQEERAGDVGPVSRRQMARMGRPRGTPIRGCRAGILGPTAGPGIRGLQAGPPPTGPWSKRRRLRSRRRPSSRRACIIKRCAYRSRPIRVLQANTSCARCARASGLSPASAWRCSWRSSRECHWSETEV